MNLSFRRRRKAATPVANVTRQSWEQPGQLTALAQIQQAPRVDYALYDALREGVPVIDAAISHLKRLVGVPDVTGDEAPVKHLRQFFSEFRVMGYNQLGLSAFMGLHIDTLLMYGKAAAEIVLSNARDGVYGLKPIPTETIQLRPLGEGRVEVAQRQVAAQTVAIPEELLFYSVNQPRGGQPHGASLLASLPFLGDIWVRIAWSMGQTWMRFGVPRYHVNTNFSDTLSLSQEEKQEAVDAGALQFKGAMEDTRDVKTLKDFFSMGQVKVEVIGAAGANLNFEVPHRAVMEQIVAVTGLPPGWLGFTWAASERLGSEQAKKTTDLIKSWRNELEPDLTALATMELALARIKGNWSLKWEQVNLTDRTQMAQAEQMEALARRITLETALQSWANGFITQEMAAREVYPDLIAVAEKRQEPAISAQPQALAFKDGLITKASLYDQWLPMRDKELAGMVGRLHGGMVNLFGDVEDTVYGSSGLSKAGGNGRNTG